MNTRTLIQAKYGHRVGSGQCTDGVPTKAARDAVAKLQTPAKTTSRTATKEQTR